MQVLVTGASGFIGSALCAHLQGRGHQVQAMARRASPQWSAGVEPWVVPDMADLGEQAFGRLQRVQAVVHCAARAHQLNDQATDPLAEFRRVNVQATVELAELAAQAGVPRFIHLSSIGVNGPANRDGPFQRGDTPQPATPYAVSKWEAETALDAISAHSGMAVVHLRPPLVYGRDAPGNFALLWKAVRSGLPLPLGGLREPRSFVALDNLVDLVAHLVEREQAVRGVHLVSDMQDLSTAEFVAAIATSAGLPMRNWPMPAPWLRRAAALLGRGEQVDKLAVRLQVNSRSLSDELGWTPPFKVGEALRNALVPAPDSHKGNR
jgi:nucleoside-diphosphate-sugar epimerase